MKAIMGINTIFSGAIQLDGRELVGMPTEAISRLGIAYVPQRENIFDELTVRRTCNWAPARCRLKAPRPR